MTKEQKGYDQIFRALADSHRLQILRLLRQRERNGGELLEQVDVVQSTLSHHMKTLCEAGLVSTRKAGKRTYYSVDGAVLRETAAFLESLGKQGELPEEKTDSVMEPVGEDIFGEILPPAREAELALPTEEKNSSQMEEKRLHKAEKKKSPGGDKPGKKEKKSGKKDKNKKKNKNKGKSDGKKQRD